MDKKSQQKTLIIKICCVIAAFILWLYTSNDGNTIKTNKISNIPVEIVNADYLKQSGFVLSPNQDFKTSLKITGKPVDIYAIKASNFKLQVDLSVYALKKGENKVPITIVNKPNSNVNIINDNSMWITIKVDNYKEKTVPIEVLINGSKREGSLDSPILKVDKVLVSGAEEYVTTVEKVVGHIQMKNQQSMDQMVALKAMDKENKTVNEVLVDPKRVKVWFQVKRLKEVEINIKTKGVLQKEYTLQGLKALDGKIPITGDEKILSKIQSLDTEPINLSNLKGNNTNIKVKLVVPEGIKISNNTDTVNVEVRIDKKLQQNITANLEIINLLKGFNAKLDKNTISLVVSGGTNVINQLKNNGIKAYINLNSLGKGEYKLPVIIDIPKDIQIVSQNYKFVKAVVFEDKKHIKPVDNNGEDESIDVGASNIKKHR